MAGEELIEITKNAYEAWTQGDPQPALDSFADDIEWIVPGNTALSGTYNGKDEIMAMWQRLPEHLRGLDTQYYLSDGERVAVLYNVQLDAGDADQVDVLTFKDGKVVKYQISLDTALWEKAFGTK
ncbi:MAG: nuclear transport factor 2 family protein [Solirubrobacterales bacterium]